jgi:hypothetical protein
LAESASSGLRLLSSRVAYSSVLFGSPFRWKNAVAKLALVQLMERILADYIVPNGLEKYSNAKRQHCGRRLKLRESL